MLEQRRGLALVLGALLSACFETRIESYPTRAAAEAAGAIARGWIPPFVPAGASELREAHNVDTNQRWLRFRIPAGDTAFLATSEAVGIGAVAGEPPPPGFGEWLQDLREPPVITRRSNLRAFRIDGGPAGPSCGAVDPFTWLVYVKHCSLATS